MSTELSRCNQGAILTHTAADGLNLPVLGLLTGFTARYGDKADPAGILVRGLTEEVGELVVALSLQQKDVSRAPNTAEEVGDVLWYVAEFSKFRKIDPDQIVAGRLNKFVRKDEPLRVPIFDNASNQLSVAEQPLGCLIISALRVIDIMDPKSLGDGLDLWVGLNEGEKKLPDALHDVLVCLGQIALTYGFQLSDAAMAMFTKNTTRGRDAHALDGTNK